MSIVYVVGARPNFVKMAPVIAALRERLPAARHVLVNTGQHYDRELSELFIDELGLPRPDHDLGVGSGTHGAQTARALERIEQVLFEENPVAVIVAGDVNSTLSAALAAVKLQIPVAHVEAGLRSFDRSMPEEVNRVLVDQISTWCFTHSPEARENLVREGVYPASIHYVGNTMIDTLVRLRPRVAQSRVVEHLGVERGKYILVTLHRPALVDDGPLFSAALAGLAALADMIPVVFPVHPRAQARMAEAQSLQGVQLIAPLGYIDFLALEGGARAVLTDSGGVQEETTYLGVPCFTLRSTTERPITVREGTNTLLGLDTHAIAGLASVLDKGTPSSGATPPWGWDGHAAERLADVFARDLVMPTPAIAGAARAPST